MVTEVYTPTPTFVPILEGVLDLSVYHGRHIHRWGQRHLHPHPTLCHRLDPARTALEGLCRATVV